MTMETLFAISEKIKRCTACPLHKTRMLPVAGKGSSDAKIIIIDGNPNEEEDRQGIPFVGESGKLLDELLELAGLKQEEVFITKNVKCFPSEIAVKKAYLNTCQELWLEKQKDLIDPKVVVVLGGIALQSLLSKNSMKKLHGFIVEKDEVKYFVSYHPEAALKDPLILSKIKKDFKKLKKLI